jgi:hypothetical protein
MLEKTVYSVVARQGALKIYIVLFPEPEAPTRATYVPGSTLRAMSRKTRTEGRVGYLSETTIIIEILTTYGALAHLKWTSWKRICPLTCE